MIAIAPFWIKVSMIIVLLFCKFRFNIFTKILTTIKITPVSNINKNPIDLYNSITLDHSENHAAAITIRNRKKEEI